MLNGRYCYPLTIQDGFSRPDRVRRSWRAGGPSSTGLRMGEFHSRIQRNFGGHAYPRLAHVGDRTGLEMRSVRSLQTEAFAGTRVGSTSARRWATSSSGSNPSVWLCGKSTSDPLPSGGLTKNSSSFATPTVTQDVHTGMDVHMEVTVTRLLKDGDRVVGAFAYDRERGRFGDRVSR